MTNEEIITELKRTISIEAASIENLLSSLDMEVMAAIVERIAGCSGRIILSGCGTSAMAAKKISHSLNCIECPSLFMTPSDAVHGGLGMLQPGDILILISKGGSTEELVNLIPACRVKGAYLIGITENPDSKIGKLADLCLKIKVTQEPCRFNMLATASTLAVVSAFDAICIALMQYTGYTRGQFAVIHPGGAVGERLTGNNKGGN